MSDDSAPKDLPAQIADAIASVPKALVPNAVKAFDRLLGAGIDIGVAKLKQYQAQIDAKTKSLTLVEGAIAKTVAKRASSDDGITDRALNSLVRKEYRKQDNKEAVARAAEAEFLNDEGNDNFTIDNSSGQELDDDWLNVFEEYAEKASSERMQGLWGRVLAGEIRKPGAFSLRTLRFLSEFSQSDALKFQELSNSAFGDEIPETLAKPDGTKDIRDLLYLEASGVISGISGAGSISRTIHFDEKGLAFINEREIYIVLKGKVGASTNQKIIPLTPLGQELLSVIPGRNTIDCARRVALTFTRADVTECYIGRLVDKQKGTITFIETLWKDELTK